jgi:hypothetical protein
LGPAIQKQHFIQYAGFSDTAIELKEKEWKRVYNHNKVVFRILALTIRVKIK